jgi:hypothetical protein
VARHESDVFGLDLDLVFTMSALTKKSLRFTLLKVKEVDHVVPRSSIVSSCSSHFWKELLMFLNVGLYVNWKDMR